MSAAPDRLSKRGADDWSAAGKRQEALERCRRAQCPGCGVCGGVYAIASPATTCARAVPFVLTRASSDSDTDV